MNITDFAREFCNSTYMYFDSLSKPYFESMIKYYKDNPTMFTIVLAFAPALLSIAYPLIVQNIGRLNDQYKSTRIIEQFKKEKLHMLFIWSLIISVILIVLCFTVSLLIFVLTFMSVIFLLIIFFRYMHLLLQYQNGQDLFQLYLKRLNIDFDLKSTFNKNRIAKQKEKIMSYWHPIIDIFLYSIRNNDRELENNIRDLFIYKTFGFLRFRDQKGEENVQYPPQVYNGTFDIVSTYLKVNDEFYYQQFESFIGSIYFAENYGVTEPQFLHQESYYAIWRNLVATIENDRMDKIIRFWHSSHQYCDFHLKVPYPKHDDNFKETLESVNQRKKFSLHREAFIQLQTALGAYLMYKHQYSALKEVWFYTQSQPPRFILVPQSAQVIFELFFTFLGFEFYKSEIVIRFWFKNLSFDEMNNKRDVKYVVCEYLGLLFLRLYIAQGYYGNHPLHVFPQIPEKQSEKKEWQDNLDIFKRIIENHLATKEVQIELGLHIITDEYCEKINVAPPIKYIDNFIQKLHEGFKDTLQNTALSKEKTDILKSNTVDSIEIVFKDICRISSNVLISSEERDSISRRMEVIRGTRILLNREAFIENTSVHHLNADSIVGEAIKNEYYYHFATKLALLPKKYIYEVSNGQIFNAIEKLNPQASDFVLLSFNLNIDYQRDFKGVEINDPIGIENYRFKSIPIYCFDFGFSPVYNTMFLVKKSSLPMVKHRDWSEIKDLTQKTKERWEAMELIDENLKIYCQIKELNTDKELRAEYLNGGKNEEELNNMIEFDVDFLGYIWFKKDAEIIEIKEAEMFQEGGSKNRIEDIIPIV